MSLPKILSSLSRPELRWSSHETGEDCEYGAGYTCPAFSGRFGRVFGAAVGNFQKQCSVFFLTPSLEALLSGGCSWEFANIQGHFHRLLLLRFSCSAHLHKDACALCPCVQHPAFLYHPFPQPRVLFVFAANSKARGNCRRGRKKRNSGDRKTTTSTLSEMDSKKMKSCVKPQVASEAAAALHSLTSRLLWRPW